MLGTDRHDRQLSPATAADLFHAQSYDSEARRVGLAYKMRGEADQPAPMGRPVAVGLLARFYYIARRVPLGDLGVTSI